MNIKEKENMSKMWLAEFTLWTQQQGNCELQAKLKSMIVNCEKLKSHRVHICNYNLCIWSERINTMKKLDD